MEYVIKMSEQLSEIDIIIASNLEIGKLKFTETE